jgi:ferredoxin-NADP reductase/DMSO/TMAO reductase YedYZ heme-binding membrane subunit
MSTTRFVQGPALPDRAAPPKGGAKVVDGPFLKRFVIACGLVPAILLVWDALQGQLGVNEVNFAIRSTGMVGLVFLVATIAITPVKRLTGWSVSIAARRNLGVFAFSYILAHFLIFFIWDRDLSVGSTLSEIVERVYLWFGFGSLVLMAPLALTSTDGWVSRLGAKRWKRLHRLAYPAAIAGVVHFYLLVKSDTTRPFVFALVLGGLLATRFIPKRKSVKKPRNFWAGELVLAKIKQETHDVKTFRFANPAGGELPFKHIPGQYLNLALTIDGKRVNRSYTIASPPTRRDYCEISVKKAVDGYASKHLHETWQEGQRIKISAPAGKFHFAGHESQRIVLIAGGIGITPMMSVIRAMTDGGWNGEMYLLFSVRLVKDIVFADEIAALQAKHPNLHVKITISGDADTPWEGARGNITREMIAGFIPGLKRGPIMLCGPDRMMTAMRDILVGMGVPDAEVHQEAFISPKAVEDAVASEADVIDESQPRSVYFKQADKRVPVTNGLTVLECAEDEGVEIPSECRSGICGQCKTRLVTGKVVMDVQDALTNADRARGLILACQARPVRDVEIDA